MDDIKLQTNSIYSDISSISKDVYNSLNSNTENNNKVELLNFFDDEQEKDLKKEQPNSNTNK